MTIEDAIFRKAELAADVLSLLLKFEQETGLIVDEIAIARIPSGTMADPDASTLGNVEVVVRL